MNPLPSPRAIQFGVLLTCILFGLQAWAFPEAKIDGIEWRDGSRVRVYVSFLDGLKRPVPLDQLADVQILGKEGKSRPEPIASFQFGAASELEDTATILPRNKSDSSLDLVIIAAGTLVSPRLNAAMDSHMRKGIAAILKNLGETDRANLLWVGDHLYTYIPSRGKTGQLSNLEDRYDDCIAVRKKVALMEAPEEGVQPGGELVDLHEEACGLVTSHGEIGPVLETPLGHGGYYPNLFGVRVPLPDITPEHRPQEVLGKREHKPLPAMGEAFKMLLHGTHEPGQRQIVLISDGEDGYLLAEADALLRFREKDCPKELDAGGKSSKDSIEKCAQRKLDQFRAAEQERFLKAASGWLAMSHAANIRVHGVGIQSSPVQLPYLADRIQVLSVESGGTYRFTPSPNEVYDALTALAEELAGQYVIEFDSGLASGESIDLRVQVKVDQGKEFESRSYPLARPVPEEKWMPELVGDRLAWVRAKVGFYWYRVIFVAVTVILALLMLWGIWEDHQGPQKEDPEEDGEGEERVEEEGQVIPQGSNRAKGSEVRTVQNHHLWRIR